MTQDNTVAVDAPVDDLTSMCAEIRQWLRVMNTPRAPRRLVDLADTEPSATSLKLRQAVSALTLIDTIVYSASAAANIIIGNRTIPVPQGADSLRVGQMVFYPSDTAQLVLSGGSPTAGPLFLEIIGWQVPPSEHFEVVR